MTHNGQEEALKGQLRKILMLAMHGVQGEQENAKRILDAKLRRYGYTLADLREEAAYECRFRYVNTTERNLLIQIIGVTLGSSRVETYRFKHLRNSVIVDLTKAQQLQVEISFEVFRKALRRDFDLFWYAFLAKNDLLLPASTESKTQLKQEDVECIAKMMAGIQRTTVRRRLGVQQ